MRYGKLTRLLATLALPIFIDTLLVMTLGAADTFMLSRYSDESVAAVGLVNQLVNIVFIIFQVISMATSILCSQYVGAGQRNRVLQVMGGIGIVQFSYRTGVQCVPVWRGIGPSEYDGRT